VNFASHSSHDQLEVAELLTDIMRPVKIASIHIEGAAPLGNRSQSHVKAKCALY
jgi:hypothetical protein